MTQTETALEQLVAEADWQPDWEAVLARAGVTQRRRTLTRRRLIVAVAVAVAVVIPLAALAAANDWWFLRGGSPSPTSAPLLVTTGVWDGHPWQLVAYPSATDGVCWSIVPGTSGDSSYGAAMSCVPVKGVPRTPQTKPGAPDVKITFMSTAASAVLPAYMAGPVIEQATAVAVRFGDGTTIKTPAFAAPQPLEHVRFYAVKLPASEAPVAATRQPALIEWLAGLDRNGRVVACLAPTSARGGGSPLSACR